MRTCHALAAKCYLCTHYRKTWMYIIVTDYAVVKVHLQSNFLSSIWRVGSFVDSDWQSSWSLISLLKIKNKSRIDATSGNYWSRNPSYAMEAAALWFRMALYFIGHLQCRHCDIFVLRSSFTWTHLPVSSRDQRNWSFVSREVRVQGVSQFNGLSFHL